VTSPGSTLLELVEAGEVLVPVATAARVLGIGRNQTYVAIAAGDIPSVRIGRSIRVPVAGLCDLVGIDRPAA
jgi:excisionase family DNA binding protein